MKTANIILIADRNPHIRSFIRRELAACGYNVRLVENGKELLKLIYDPTRIDLLVLDPDFPGVDAIDMARKIADRIPQLPVVLYCIRGTDNLADFDTENIFYVEKDGKSIETLKATIQNILSDTGTHAPPSASLHG